MKKTESKNTVIGNYPKAECREISTPSGSYYMIYDMEVTPPNLLGYNMANQSDPTDQATEAKAWDMAAGIIGERMVEVLEN